MNINIAIDAYAVGTITRNALEQFLHSVGFSPFIVSVLLRKADCKKDKVKSHENHENYSPSVQKENIDCIAGRYAEIEKSIDQGQPTTAEASQNG